MRVAAAIVFSAALLQASTLAQRSQQCDDGAPAVSSCGYIFPDVDTVTYCNEAEVMALQGGCYRCVDNVTCDIVEYGVSEMPADLLVYASTSTPAPYVAPILASPSSIPTSLVILPDQEHEGEMGMQVFAEQDTIEVHASATRPQGPAMQEVSNWYFVVPTFLALVSIGLAIRGRLDRRHQFERVQEEAIEEINPFCGDPASPPINENDLECGQQYDSDDAVSGQAS